MTKDISQNIGFLVFLVPSLLLIPIATLNCATTLHYAIREIELTHLGLETIDIEIIQFGNLACCLLPLSVLHLLVMYSSCDITLCADPCAHRLLHGLHRPFHHFQLCPASCILGR
jgi:hypothetical protein